MVARPWHVPLVAVGRDDATRGLDLCAVADRPVADVLAARLDLEVGRREAPRAGPLVKTSRRRASITGTAPGAPAARASSVETPATGRSSASAEPAGRGEPDPSTP